MKTISLGIITLGLGIFIIENIRAKIEIKNAEYNDDKIVIFKGIIKDKCYVKGITGIIREGEYQENKCLNKENKEYDKSVN
jgi:hypothetical protein